MLPPEELRRQHQRSRSSGLLGICDWAERRHRLPKRFLLAVASRETNCRDVVGDGGHGRGVFQIDDRFHRAWLADHDAAGPGETPPLGAAADYAARILASAYARARDEGLRGQSAATFAAAAYNAGLGGALAGLHEGDADARTTGRDYGRDVVSRMVGFRALERAEGT